MSGGIYFQIRVDSSVRHLQKTHGGQKFQIF